MLKQAIFLFSVACSGSAFAEIYKCSDSLGNTSFQAQPCADDQNTEWAKETETERRHRIEQERMAEQLRLKQEQQANQTIERHVSTLPGESGSTKLSEKDLWDEVETPDEVKKATLNYLDEALRDPDSLKDLEWVQTFNGIGEHKTLINYRATNAYGGYVRSEKVITVNRDGKVTDFKDYLPLPVWLQ